MIRRQQSPTLYTVPAGTEVARCKGPQCQAVIYFVDSLKTPGKKIPIDCGCVGGQTPTELASGLGILHPILCEDRDRFADHRPPARRHRHQRSLDIAVKPAACIFCGCTQERACRIPAAEAGLPAMLSGMIAQDGTIGCSWIQLEPTPVCSAPACREKYQELPLRMRVKPAKLRRAN